MTRPLVAMISSTSLDLPRHREAAIEACLSQDVQPKTMEHAPPAGRTAREYSLDLVDEADIFVLLLGFRYGACPPGEERSYTHLEYERAKAQGKPMVALLMSEDHALRAGDVETGPGAERVHEFRRQVGAERVVSTFTSVDDMKARLVSDVAAVREKLGGEPPAARIGDGEIPRPPRLYAEPPYIGSHAFVGRTAQLEVLNDWARPADPHPVLLFEAIGGAGKSMLTWEWTTRHAPAARDWAGRFWYSFYERGAVMADFCRHALAYTTGRPLAEYSKIRQLELSRLLIAELRARPWLLVLDGLERVLVAYHRADAAQLADEDAGSEDILAQRDPCAAIRPQDDELLRALTTAEQSKILVTSRLVPRTLLNASGQPIPGVVRERLPGLRPADAEAMLRAAGVNGDPAVIQDYLQRHCDCHPLVCGVVAGLVTRYLPARGDFDAWAADLDHGGHLDVGTLDLVGKRNHILQTAIRATSAPGRQLLSTLALLSDAVDYETLEAFNPHRPRQPEFLRHLGPVSPTLATARRQLADTVADLEGRGLMQYDTMSRRYDLHPVVRAVSLRTTPLKDRNKHGQQVVDYFSARQHDPYEQAESLTDLAAGLTVVRTLLHLDRHLEAADAYRDGGLGTALAFNLEAYGEMVALIRSFFPTGWSSPVPTLEAEDVSHLAKDADIALSGMRDHYEAFAAGITAVRADLVSHRWFDLYIGVSNVGFTLVEHRRLASAERCRNLELQLAEALNEDRYRFGAYLDLCRHHRTCGHLQESDYWWAKLESMERAWPRSFYRPGDAELEHAYLSLQRGTLQDAEIDSALNLATAGRNRGVVREIHILRGLRLIGNRDWAAAVQPLEEAVRMAREADLHDSTSETWLALAHLHNGRLPDSHDTAQRLANYRQPTHLALGHLWRALGDTDRAVHHADLAYREAWADGEPFVFRHDLDQAAALLTELGAPIPDLPPYDPANDPPFDWEADVAAAIKELRAER